MPCYLGIDYGHKRLGLAISDPAGRLATPLRQLPSTGSVQRDAARLQAIIQDYRVEAVVIGLPLNMDGTEGDQARRTRRYGEALGAALGLSVSFYDERLTTHAADRLLDDREELTTAKRKARRDAIAAQTMLQDFLDAASDSGAR